MAEIFFFKKVEWKFWKCFFFLFCENKGNLNFMLYHVLLIWFSLYVEFEECHSCISMEIWNVIKPLFHSLMKLTINRIFFWNEKVNKHEKTLDFSMLPVLIWSYLSFQTFQSWLLLLFLESVDFAVIALTYILAFFWLTSTQTFVLNFGQRNAEAFVQNSGIQLFLKKNKIDGVTSIFKLCKD